MPLLGRCKLCELDRELRESHILPKWSYRHVLGSGDDRTPAPAIVTGTSPLAGLRARSAFTSNRQLTEPMLCEECEQLFGRAEARVSRELVQPDDTFPLLERLEVPEGPPHVQRVGECPGDLDASLIARFAASVVWRASASRLFPRVCLGPYSERFRTYLLTPDALWPESASLHVHLMTDPPGAWRSDRVLVPPVSSKQPDGYHQHGFVICGAVFTLCGGATIPAVLLASCFTRTQAFTVGSHEPVRRNLAAMALNARPRGRLARDS